jgi:UDP-N-acetylglucosamine--N-acetylmuramyl-(pentapeptide) pyrophosphoryl-undecaprenol N-acetylglucosamine transferase
MDDHQTANAHQLANIGGGLCRAEAELDAASLADDISTLFGDAEQLVQMGHNAQKLAMPDAAKAIADYALALGDSNSQQPTHNISGGQS